MRAAAVGVLLSIFSVVSVAEGSPRSRFMNKGSAGPIQFEQVPHRPGLAMDLVRQTESLRAIRSAKRIDANIVRVDSSTFGFTIPAAGSLQGGGGTFFKSDVTLANYEDNPRRILVIWLARGTDGSNAPVFRTTLPDAPPVTTRDFVTALGLSGLGSLFVVAVDSADQVDASGNIDGFSRIWTNQPGAAGTVSQPFPGMDDANLYGEFEAIALGLRQDAGYRSNAGVVNLDDQAHRFTVTVLGENTEAEFTIDVPALSMQQISLGSDAFGALTLIFTPDVDDVDFGWLAYGTSVDNITGDGWVSNAGRVSDTE